MPDSTKHDRSSGWECGAIFVFGGTRNTSENNLLLVPSPTTKIVCNPCVIAEPAWLGWLCGHLNLSGAKRCSGISWASAPEPAIKALPTNVAKLSFIVIALSPFELSAMRRLQESFGTITIARSAITTSCYYLITPYQIQHG